MGTQFAGEVFLATSLIHFLNDSAGTFADLTAKTYPFVFMLASAGYVSTLLADCIVASLTSGGKREARVLFVEEGRTPEEQPKEVHVDVNPEFLRTTSFGTPYYSSSPCVFIQYLRELLWEFQVNDTFIYTYCLHIYSLVIFFSMSIEFHLALLCGVKSL